MTTELTTPSFAREMTDQELDSVHGGARRVYLVFDGDGNLIAIVVVDC